MAIYVVTKMNTMAMNCAEKKVAYWIPLTRPASRRQWTSSL